MKHLFLTAGLLLAAAGTQAQIASGTKMVGGSIGYTRNHNAADNGESTDQQFLLAPRVGYFLSDRWAVGLSLTGSAFKATGTSRSPGLPSHTATNRGNGWFVGPFVRHYTMLSNSFGLFGQLAAGYAYSSSRTTVSDAPNAHIAKFTQKGAEAELLPGLVFFPHPKLGIEAVAGGLLFQKLRNEATTNEPNSPSVRSNSDSFKATFGLEYLRLGASLYFGQRP